MTGPMTAPPPAPGGSEAVDEARWNSWLLSNAARNRRDAANRMIAVKITAIAATVMAALPWTYPAPYQLPGRLAISIGALAALNQSARAKQYVLAVMFVAVLIIYNPLYAVFQTAAGWPLLPFPLFTAAAFAASLFWPNPRTGGLTIAGSAERASISTQEDEGGASRGLDGRLREPRPKV